MTKTTVSWALILALGWNSTASAIQFLPLGDFPGGDFISYAYGISGDGSTVVGTSHSAPNQGEAFRWTKHTGIVGLGGSEAFAINYNGEYVVGNTGVGGAVWQSQGFSSTVIHQFPFEPSDISLDGSVVVGWAWQDNPSPTSDYAVAIRWTSTEGVTLLDGGVPHSLAYGISADAQTIVGSIQEGPYQAFRWTEAEGMVGLGHLSGGSGLSDAYDVSADGTVVVGRSKSLLGTGNFTEAFRWIMQDGMVGLGDLPGGDFDSEALAISADGTVIVGRGVSEIGSEAFRWTQGDGMVSIRQHLIAAGIDLTGWFLDSAVDISDDGNVIVGYGRNPQGGIESWIADFSISVPEPANWTLVMMFLLMKLTTRTGRCQLSTS